MRGALRSAGLFDADALCGKLRWCSTSVDLTYRYSSLASKQQAVYSMGEYTMVVSLIKDALRQIIPIQQKRLLIRYALANGTEVALDQLRVEGFRPGAAIDIGAYHGTWTKTFARVFP